MAANFSKTFLISVSSLNSLECCLLLIHWCEYWIDYVHLYTYICSWYKHEWKYKWKICTKNRKSYKNRGQHLHEKFSCVVCIKFAQFPYTNCWIQICCSLFIYSRTCIGITESFNENPYMIDNSENEITVQICVGQSIPRPIHP